MREMISPEEARELVLSKVQTGRVVTVGLLDALGRVAAQDVVSDMDVSPFAHSAMDGFALRSQDIAQASEGNPVKLRVIADLPAGSCHEGAICEGECVRIMTGAAVPEDADAVVKYEIVGVEEGDGKAGSLVSFTAPAKLRANIREAGEEAKAGETVLRQGEIVSSAGAGFLASCGSLSIDVYARPKVAIIATGSELVDPSQLPRAGKIRNSNSYAMAACAKRAGCEPAIFPIVEDTLEALKRAIVEASEGYDFIVTTGGAANGDFDFIKQAIDDLGELCMSTVNMRPGKAQAFGMVNGVPVFGLPGNPAAAYVGFELLIRPALRKMLGYTCLDPQVVRAALSKDVGKRDLRRIYLRSTLRHAEDGSLVVEPASKQSSGLFGVIQRSNCLAIMPEGLEAKKAGDLVDCVLLDIPEEAVF